MRLNDGAADYTPKAQLTRSILHNCHWDTYAYLFSPPNAWANVDDCGDWPCTGPLQALIMFDSTTFTGTILPPKLLPNFQIVPANDENIQAFNNCTKVPVWNGYYCNNEKLAIVTFESVDEDFNTRILSPVYLTNSVINSKNAMNTFMDH